MGKAMVIDDSRTMRISSPPLAVLGPVKPVMAKRPISLTSIQRFRRRFVNPDALEPGIRASVHHEMASLTSLKG